MLLTVSVAFAFPLRGADRAAYIQVGAVADGFPGVLAPGQLRGAFGDVRGPFTRRHRRGSALLNMVFNCEA